MPTLRTEQRQLENVTAIYSATRRRLRRLMYPRSCQILRDDTAPPARSVNRKCADLLRHRLASQTGKHLLPMFARVSDRSHREIRPGTRCRCCDRFRFRKLNEIWRNQSRSELHVVFGTFETRSQPSLNHRCHLRRTERALRHDIREIPNRNPPCVLHRSC